MSNNEGKQNNEEPQLDEKTILLQQCRTMGIPVSNNSSVETLREKIAAHRTQIEKAEESEARNLENGDVGPSELGEHAIPASANLHSVRKRLYDKMMALVRVRITNLDTKKSGLQGEFVTFYNDILGQVKYFVPFGEVTENGWHLPRVIVDVLKEREFQHIRTYTDPRTKQIRVETSLRKEFVIEELPPLTESELADLRAAQVSQ